MNPSWKWIEFEILLFNHFSVVYAVLDNLGIEIKRRMVTCHL